MSCEHDASLVYFDRVNGRLWSWEVCDFCGARFNDTTPKGDEELREEAQLEEWLQTYRYNAGVRDTF